MPYEIAQIKIYVENRSPDEARFSTEGILIYGEDAVGAKDLLLLLLFKF